MLAGLMLQDQATALCRLVVPADHSFSLCVPQNWGKDFAGTSSSISICSSPQNDCLSAKGAILEQGKMMLYARRIPADADDAYQQKGFVPTNCRGKFESGWECYQKSEFFFIESIPPAGLLQHALRFKTKDATFEVRFEVDLQSPELWPQIQTVQQILSTFKVVTPIRPNPPRLPSSPREQQ